MTLTQAATGERIASLLFLWIGVVGCVHAESALRLPLPNQFGSVAAVVYDTHGRPDGHARLTMEQVPDGARLRVVVHLDDGAHSRLQALMRAADGGLRIVSERSASFDAHGKPVVQARLDHDRGVGICQVGDGPARRVTLPSPDRIVNVPLNLLLRPLVNGARTSVRFQTFVCGDDIRILDTEAKVAKRIAGPDGGPGYVELHYHFNFGPLLSLVAGPFVPKIAFWFDPTKPAHWVGHEMPLYSDGPEVMVLRKGVLPADLTGRAYQARNDAP
ncbi:MAG: hypothetical protein P8076_10060 [Gammaproteobacteria bacterium]